MLEITRNEVEAELVMTQILSLAEAYKKLPHVLLESNVVLFTSTGSQVIGYK